jgi:hypothetical protein
MSYQNNLNLRKLVEQVLTAYHTTRLAEVDATTHILSKYFVQNAADALVADAILVAGEALDLASKFQQSKQYYSVEAVDIDLNEIATLQTKIDALKLSS